MNQPAEELTHQPAAQAQPPSVAPAAASAPTDSRRKSPFLAVVLSAMPGLGQVYVGYYKRGFIHAIVIAVLITLLSADALGPLVPLGSLFLAFFWLYNLVDAGRRAALYNQALAGGTEIELPEEFQELGFRGSLLGGSLLVATGLVLLLHTRFGMSLDWIEQWWPLAVVAFGGYLVYKALQERPAADDDSYDA